MGKLDEETWLLASSGEPPRAEAPHPRSFGRYEVIRLLGQGGFARVYLARDADLDRLVALKAPRREHVVSEAHAALFLAEGRVLARLDHANIVPVLDVGRTVDKLCYVVSRYIEGTDLAARLAQGPLPHDEAARLVATVADALDHAHARHLFHRDVKPSNILIDLTGKPWLADFGLALHDDDLGKGPELAGTPHYMSPEQARGEGNRLDGRSDIFSLGVVFYELLAGRRPFRGDSLVEILANVIDLEARPPRQFQATVPPELERICLRALAKRPSDRYPTARDLAADLRAFLARELAPPSTTVNRPDNLLHAMWDSLEPGLQDAFALAFNKKRRLGGDRISTRDFFQALARIEDGAVRSLIAALPPGAMPEPVDATVTAAAGAVLAEAPLLSSCVTDSLEHFRQHEKLPRKLAPADVFVDIAKHGRGESVARLRRHGVDRREIDQRVRELGLAVLDRPAG